jgi:hypothetical protein
MKFLVIYQDQGQIRVTVNQSLPYKTVSKHPIINGETGLQKHSDMHFI